MALKFLSLLNIKIFFEIMSHRSIILNTLQDEGKTLEKPNKLNLC